MNKDTSKSQPILLCIVAPLVLMFVISALLPGESPKTGVENKATIFGSLRSPSVVSSLNTSLKTLNHYPNRTMDQAEIERATEKAANFYVLSSTSASARIISASTNKNILFKSSLLDQDTVISEDMIVVTPGKQSYQLNGLRDKQKESAVVGIPFDRRAIPAGYLDADIRTFLYNNKQKTWEELPKEGIDKEKDLVYSRTHTDGTMINGIIKSPELPQTDMYMPTSMKDIKLADPAARVQTIEAPVANSHGTASLTYPLDVPKGRNGIEPNLAITYNSDAGDGLLGEGWNLNLSSITVDTRWGVPAFNAGTETETYNLDGEMLAFDEAGEVKLAHRSLNVPRRPERRFNQRRLKNFNQIIRHGDSPSTYWWEVIDAAGTRYFYGQEKRFLGDVGEPQVAFNRQDPLAVIKNHITNSIAEWKLTRVEDKHGNTMVYTYEKDQGLMLGPEFVQNSIIKTIKYTGYQKDGAIDLIPYNYIVKFDNDKNDNLQYSARYGFLSSNRWRIRKITVEQLHYNDNSAIPNNRVIRSYEMVYDSGPSVPFGKTLLKTITQLDEDGIEFNHHDFSYYNDVSDGFFSASQQYSSPAAPIGGLPIASNLALPGTRTTGLGGSNSEGNGFAFYGGFGLNDGQMTSRNLTVGVEGGFNKSSSEGLNALIDIDGDALPDKVFSDGRRLAFRKNNGNGFDTKPKSIEGITQFSVESSYTTNRSINLYFGGNASLNETRTKSEQSTYFSDVNGDGLVDIVQNGKVMFNHIINGVPTFNPSSSGTPVPISGGAIQIPDNLNYTKVSNDLASDNPQHDVVRRWVAQFSGKIAIDAPVALIVPDESTLSTAQKLVYKNSDGVTVSIQKNSGNTVNGNLWSRNIAKGDGSFTTLGVPASLQVNKGDRLYFRVQSGTKHLANGDFDKVNWTPKITYIEHDGVPVADDGRYKDAFGKNRYQYKISEDDLLGYNGGVSLPVTANATLQGLFRKGKTADDIEVEVVQYSENINDPVLENGKPLVINGKPEYNYSIVDILFAKKFAGDSTVTSLEGSTAITFPIKEKSLLTFRVKSKVNVNMSAIKWEPYLFYPNRNTVTPDNDTLHFVPEFLFKGRPDLNGEFWSAFDTTKYTIKPLLKFNSKFPASAWFTVRKGDSLLSKATLNYKDSIILTPVKLEIQLNKNDEVFAGFETDDPYIENLQAAHYLISDFANQKASANGLPGGVFEAPVNGTYHLRQFLKFKQDTTVKVGFSVLRSGTPIDIGFMKYARKKIVDTTIVVTLKKGDKISVQYSWPVPSGMPGSIIPVPVDSSYFYISLQLNADFWNRQNDTRFGPMYRGWGQFTYNDLKNGFKPINEALLIEPAANQANINSSRGMVRGQFPATDADTLKSPSTNSTLNQLDPVTRVFGKLYPTAEDGNRRWKGIDADVFIKEGIQSTSRIGLKHVVVVSPFIGVPNIGSGAVAVNKITESKNKSYNIRVGVSGSRSSGSTTTLADFFDVNGDRFPDIVANKSIQYTNPTGTLGDIATDAFNHVSQNNNLGVGIGGTFPKSVSFNSPGNARTTDAATVGMWRTNNSSEGDAENSGKNRGVTGNVVHGNDYPAKTWLDVNGDGLVDKIIDDEQNVQLNKGNGFTGVIGWNGLRKAQGSNISLSPDLPLGFSTNDGSISGGTGASLSRSLPTSNMQDINGDGLIDIIEIDGNNLYAYINKGNDFLPRQFWVKLSETSAGDHLPGLGNYLTTWNSSFNSSAGLSVGGTFTFGYPVPAPFPPFPPIFKIVFSPSLNHSNGLGGTLRQFTDINGDGFADYLYSDDERTIHVQLSKIGRTNKLKEVVRPLGSSFVINYKHSDATYDHPGGKWVLNMVVANDGIKEDRLVDNGFDYKQTFTYTGGKYDRYEREFLGFKLVTTNELDYNDQIVRKRSYHYDNQRYYTVANVISDIIEDGNGQKLLETINGYYHNSVLPHNDDYTLTALPQIPEILPQAIIFTPVRYVTNKAYEGEATGKILNESYFEYDNRGNNTLSRYSDKGNLMEGEFDYECIKTYNPFNSANQTFGLLKDYVIRKGATIFRKGSASYNLKGDLENETVAFDDTASPAVTTYVYEKDDISSASYGNIEKKVLPGGFTYIYTYDTKLNTYPVKIQDSYGYTSSWQDFNTKYGLPTQTKDVSDNTTEYRIDKKGRIDQITGVREVQANAPSKYTIKMTYPVNAQQLSYATTQHFDEGNPNNGIITKTFIDGFKRNIQVKKNAVILKADGLSDNTKTWITSGRIKYDALGRAVEQYYPAAEASDTYSTNPQPAYNKPAVISYDLLDRKLETKLPDGAVYANYSYAFEGNNMATKTTLLNTNPSLHKVSYEVFNGSGLKVEDRVLNGTKINTTKYGYDGIHQLVSVTDNKNQVTAKTYDWAGRIKNYTLADGGKTAFEYTLIGNISKKTLPDGETVDYKYYNDYTQLESINYSKSKENNVRYVYGAASNDGEKLSKGRLIFQEDASGGQKFAYDEMGNVKQVTRSIIAPFDQVYTFRFEYKYDSWNRIRQVVYPDLDTVNYSYNTAGLLNKVSGTRGKTYVSNIGYDEFEQRTMLAYGNGTKTTYAYDDKRRQLKNLKAVFADGRSFMNTTYGYDNLNNIMAVTNESSPGNGLADAKISHAYIYDNLGQLTKANGKWNDKITYAVGMNYNDRYDIAQKSLELKSESLNRTRNLAYTYTGLTTHLDRITETSSRTHIPSKSIDMHYNEKLSLDFDYDKMGNNTSTTTGDLDTKRQNADKRQIVYDEENRVKAVNLNGFISNYIYDDKGERTVKLSTQTDEVFVNGQKSGESSSASSFSLYVNPYFSTRNGGGLYTKHIYIGGQKIASEIASYNNNAAPIQCLSPNEKCFNIKYDTKLIGHDSIVNNMYDRFNLSHKQIADNAFRRPIPLTYDGVSTPLGENDNTPVDVSAGLLYYYHTNQINSTSYVTNKDGKVVEYIEYLPNGETFMEQRKGYSAQFIFTGKETDRETGLSYFGARYYDPKTSVWLSIDPAADKYPGISPYNYCLNNPVRLTDPDGTTVVIDEFGYIKSNDNKGNIVKMGDKIVGNLNGKIDANTFYKNLITQNSKKSADIYSPITFYNNVRGKGEWDLKNNKNTIFGLANGLKGQKTNFDFNGEIMSAQDIGNHHFGIVGKAYGYFSEEFMLRQAGAAQIAAGTSEPSFIKYSEHLVPAGKEGISLRTQRQLLPPYGDDWNDQKWIKNGFEYYKRNFKDQ